MSFTRNHSADAIGPSHTCASGVPAQILMGYATLPGEFHMQLLGHEQQYLVEGRTIRTATYVKYIIKILCKID